MNEDHEDLRRRRQSISENAIVLINFQLTSNATSRVAKKKTEFWYR